MKSLYATCGKPECFDFQVFDQGHADTPALRQAEYAWFDRWLGKGHPGITPIADEPVPEALRHRPNVLCFPSPPADAAHIEQQFTPPMPRREIKGEADFFRFKQELSARLREEVLRTAFLPFKAELKEEGGGLVLIVDEGLRHRAVLFSKQGVRRKTVILLSSAGKADVEKLSHEFLAAGVNLLVVEPSGVDNTEFPKGERQHVFRLAMLVGETLTSLRVRDALGAVRALVASPAVDPKGIYLWGKGELAIPALYAGVVDQRIAGVFLEDVPGRHTSETALFRILRYADVPQSAALLFPRPLFFLGQAGKDFLWTEEVYRQLGQPGRCKRSVESPATIVSKY